MIDVAWAIDEIGANVQRLVEVSDGLRFQFVFCRHKGEEMKKVIAGLVMVCATMIAAFAQDSAAEENANQVQGNNGSVHQCYPKLTEDSSEQELLQAIDCLRKSTSVGELEITTFTFKNSKLISKFTTDNPKMDIREALSALSGKKKEKKDRLYFFVETPYGKALYVPNWYQFGRPSAPVPDIASRNLRMTTTSHIFGSDETVPLEDVKSFYYGGPRARNTGLIGDFKVITVNGTRLDSSYQNPFPIKDYPDNVKWSALVSVSGTSYVKPYQGSASKQANATLELATERLAETTVSLISADEAQKWIDSINKEMAVAQQAQEKKAQAVAIERQKEAETIKNNSAQMANLPRGSEDSCKRIIAQQYIIPKDPEYALMKCQFGGLVSTEVLPQAGWLIVNKTRDSDGIVTDYYIRKAR